MGVLDNFTYIRSDIHVPKLFLDSLGILELIELRGKVVLFEVISSFTLLDLLMDLIFHLIDGVMVIGDLEGLAIELIGSELLIDLAVSIEDLSDKFLEFFRGLELDGQIFSVQS